MKIMLGILLLVLAGIVSFSPATPIDLHGIVVVMLVCTGALLFGFGFDDWRR